MLVLLFSIWATFFIISFIKNLVTTGKVIEAAYAAFLNPVAWTIDYINGKHYH
jgi:hypothetical protein